MRSVEPNAAGTGIRLQVRSLGARWLLLLPLAVLVALAWHVIGSESRAAAREIQRIVPLPPRASAIARVPGTDAWWTAHSPAPVDSLRAFYRAVAAADGWQTTTDTAVEERGTTASMLTLQRRDTSLTITV
ncbi:MAG TPA: hypothetical protein VEA99_03930, partial [Gemmatimonadaceae bacterium]|nr:hypothetical protein [Gemmatimonadaceae bacterium]